jgi:hypothetical protein
VEQLTVPTVIATRETDGLRPQLKRLPPLPEGVTLADLPDDWAAAPRRRQHRGGDHCYRADKELEPAEGPIEATRDTADHASGRQPQPVGLADSSGSWPAAIWRVSAFLLSCSREGCLL